MRHIALSVFLALTMTAAVPPVFAAGSGSKGQSASAAAYYRYRNAQGVLVMERAIPPEYVGKGYQVLNSFMQVIEDVPPAKILTEEERRAKTESDATNSRKDSELRKLYSAPQDAERLRDRQLEALGLKIDHARGQMNQAAGQRKTEVEQAARTERAGKPVPQHARDNIDRLTRQVNVHEQEIKALEAEQQRMRSEFEPIIARLRVIYPNKVDPAAVPATAPAAAPAAVQAPVPAPAAVAAKPAAPVAVAAPAAVKPAPVPVAAPAVAAAKPAAPPAAPTVPAVQAPAKPVAPAAVVPAAKPAAPPAVAAPVAPPKPTPAAPVAAKPAPAPAKPVGTVPEPTIKPKEPAPPSTVPPVAPVSKSKEKTSKPASSESEKATAKEKAKEMLDLETEPRGAGGLRPTGF